MLGKENTKGQVIDNQMDYVDDESTIGAKGGINHEDRSSIVFPKANDKGITKYLSYNGI
ncbi:hypothetical protein [Wolbachia endosymbiont of Frankliniella intonsa]|uniref:hypothetical protein n=1 Tax=Wolbachia endosymbiont of Frankliniella intonsa TaxID=2902422 RepID=UPI00244EFD4D|nr:hypothetical protein [Wolbachia endosymbiont of Frankliniella intonsa]WGJ62688.1 hypothetical protein M3L71_03880 [Wolbachia endosymbiont of Frankliniella intonsa]